MPEPAAAGAVASARRGAAPAALLWKLAWAGWRHERGRRFALLFALTLGVALAAAVHLVNQAALDAFARGVKAVHGEPDASLRGGDEGVDDAWYARIGELEGVRQATPVLELRTQARRGDAKAQVLRIHGVDAMSVAGLAPALMPIVDDRSDRLAPLRPGRLYLNAGAMQALGVQPGEAIAIQAQGRWVELEVAGRIALGGAAAASMDIAAVQDQFGLPGRLTRIDLRVLDERAMDRLRAMLPAGTPLHIAMPQEDERRATGVSRAYRVNLTVLALVALAVGGFMAFTVQSLAVAQRSRQFGLLGVLGMDAATRSRAVLFEAAAIGSVAALLGLLLARLLAQAALRWLDGDLGAGWLSSDLHALPEAPWAMFGFALLGPATACAGAAWPARRAAALRPMHALRHGLPPGGDGWPAPLALALLAAGVGLAALPPWGGVPVAAYASVAALLVGGIALVPALLRWALAAWPIPKGAVARLARHRALRERGAAATMVAGVVASVALSAALLVMVASFRGSVECWLDDVLPADLMARTSGGSGVADHAGFDADLVPIIERVPGVRRVVAWRSRPLTLDPLKPAAVLLARDLSDPAAALPLVSAVRAVPQGRVAVHASETLAALQGLRPGDELMLPLQGRRVPATVASVWRDYARPSGALAMDLAAYEALTGDRRRNELAIWLEPGARFKDTESAVRSRLGDAGALDFASALRIRAESLRIFDRSFVVTRVLQAVAVAIGLAGVAAGLSAQVLARRRELGLLAHLGLTRRQLRSLVLAEAAAVLALGVVVGLALGAAISLVLVWVVNPQSFHWTMDLHWPAASLAGLAGMVWAAGMATAALAAALALREPPARAVREDS